MPYKKIVPKTDKVKKENQHHVNIQLPTIERNSPISTYSKGQSLIQALAEHRAQKKLREMKIAGGKIHSPYM